MKINNETKLFISVSSKPGNFGATVFNQLFAAKEINAVYLPRLAPSAKKLINALRTLDIKGCSVSTPLKTQVVDLLDELDPIAEKTNSVNTIVNVDSKLKGYNTDLYGAKTVLSDGNFKSALIYGAGSVTNSVVHALKELGCSDISIVARRPEQAKIVARKHKIKALSDTKKLKERYDLMVNCTPASDDPDHAELSSLCSHCSTIFDLLVKPTDTHIIKKVRSIGKTCFSGFEMAKHQLHKQFELYTGQAIHFKEVSKFAENYVQS